MKYVVVTLVACLALAGCFNPVGSGDPPDSENVVPDQVTGLVVDSSTLSSATISWTEVTGDETPSAELTYEIHWSSAAGESASGFVADVSVDGTTTATIENLPGFTPIYISVRAVDGQGAPGPGSTEVLLTTTSSLTFADGSTALVENTPSGVYRAANVHATSLGTSIFLTWNDSASGNDFFGVVLEDGQSLFTTISGGGYSLTSSVGGGTALFLTDINAGALTVGEYAPAPTDSWSDATGSAPSGDTDEFATLGDLGGTTHLVRVSDDGVNQQAVLLERGGADWTAVSGGPIYTDSPGRWVAPPEPPVALDGSIHVMGSSSTGPEVITYNGTGWADITDTAWVGDTGTAVAATAEGLFALTIDGSGVGTVWQYSGAGADWTAVVADIRYDATKIVNDADAEFLNGTLYVAWTETSATGDRTRVGAYTASAASPSWQIIDGAGAEGLNSDPTTYSAQQPTLLAHGDSLYIFFTESTGTLSVDLLQSYKTQ